MGKNLNIGKKKLLRNKERSNDRAVILFRLIAGLSLFYFISYCNFGATDLHAFFGHSSQFMGIEISLYLTCVQLIV